MTEDTLSNDAIQEFLFSTRQKLGSLPDLNVSATEKDAEELKGT